MKTHTHTHTRARARARAHEQNLASSRNQICRRECYLVVCHTKRLVPLQVPQHRQVVLPPCGRRAAAVRLDLRALLPQRARLDRVN